jgi:hypothetical protein
VQVLRRYDTWSRVGDERCRVWGAGLKSARVGTAGERDCWVCSGFGFGVIATSTLEGIATSGSTAGVDEGLDRVVNTGCAVHPQGRAGRFQAFSGC